MSLRTIALLSGIVCLPGMAAAQAPAAPAPEATAAATNCTKPDEGADMNTVISRAVSCVGWIKQPPAADGRGTGLVADVARAPSPPGRSSVLSVAASTTGVSEAANELFSLIVQIAVDKAKREGLAMLHDELARAVCDLKIPLTKLDPATKLPPLQLNETCKLITDTDLQALLGQGAALRAALTADLVGAAQAVAADKLAPFPPLAQGGQAGIALIKRVIADPNSHLTLNDVWLVAEPVLNTGWQDIKDDDLKKLNPNLDLAKIKQAIAAIQYSLASARVAIGKPNNFFVVGAMFSYSPQFVNTTINNTTTPYSATKYGLFVHYYFSLWDLN